MAPPSGANPERSGGVADSAPLVSRVGLRRWRVSEDLRSSRMPSAEGRGRARGLWDAYQSGVRRVVVEPALDPVARHYGSGVVSEVVGFWVLWHLHGGFEGLLKSGMPRTTIFRKVKRFREVFGQHPDEYVFPGISIDLDAYWSVAADMKAKRKRDVAAVKAERKRSRS